MARGPGKARDFDFSNVGTTGRRTGITLAEGRRDEHGMEEVDGLFSSPEKSPTKLNGFEEDESDASVGSEMSMDEDNAPGPMDFLKASNRTRESLLAPPLGSPAKHSPRKSPVLRSSPELENEFVSSSPSDGKGLTEARQDPSPLSTRSVNAGVSNSKSNSRPTKAQLAVESVDVHDFSDGEGDENANSFGQLQDDFGDNFDAGNESIVRDDEVPEQDLSTESSPAAPAAALSRPTDKKSLTAKPSRKAPTANALQPTNDPPKRRGRPPKTQRPAADEGTDARPHKKQKTSPGEPRTTREQLDPELDRVIENYAQRSGPLKGRSLYILKRENPSDTSATHTRSGRVSVRPLAYWRNERCVFGDGEAAEGQRFPLSTIKEVIRTEDAQADQQKKSKRAGRKSKKNKQREDSSDEEDEEADVWEKEGVLHGYVPKWDPKTQASTSEEEVLDIAYAPSGIETREVKDSTFRFAKLLSSSFIGSGVVELPPEGVKKPKNSKKMHMVFYVCHGRVQVDISGVQFSAGKGCVFQVPRGNYYSFMNQHSREARLFFTQGCVPGEDETSASKHDVQESEFEPESATPAPPAKTRGRPKGKQKAK
ncbi:hypothetical protein N7523_003072 [Penicillium sp. IBT 18751x]|nr:hypothetical protein N7523_003072 [Penicillium sp. IBT 18751x]